MRTTICDGIEDFNITHIYEIITCPFEWRVWSKHGMQCDKMLW